VLNIKTTSNMLSSVWGTLTCQRTYLQCSCSCQNGRGFHSVAMVSNS